MPAHPPTDLAERGQRPQDAVRGSALESLAAGRRPTPEQLRVLAATGIAPPDHRPPERPWGPIDDLVARRLSLVRGWSPAAIAIFVNRPEAQVRAALDPWRTALIARRTASARGMRQDASGPV